MTNAVPAWRPCIQERGIAPSIDGTVIVHRSKRSVAVLEEWIRNVPLAQVERIVADRKVQGTPIWSLASIELLRRQQAGKQAA
ncbi:hypothetical protein amb1992 [Paramagnetospirillum magneticum AMB-1]|uniref:Uncharacterized protein n=1 Tax=Paramagnetospirillum magneticum (strain ATCC 700264 / AMB-1) TaxID=342108 RepID=Q2W5S9_PARM1|nr:hypothetical protein amb1992 [Paramagnetospirillum magneticum AMB-1]